MAILKCRVWSWVIELHKSSDENHMYVRRTSTLLVKLTCGGPEVSDVLDCFMCPWTPARHGRDLSHPEPILRHFKVDYEIAENIPLVECLDKRKRMKEKVCVRLWQSVILQVKWDNMNNKPNITHFYAGFVFWGFYLLLILFVKWFEWKTCLVVVNLFVKIKLATPHLSQQHRNHVFCNAFLVFIF